MWYISVDFLVTLEEMEWKNLIVTLKLLNLQIEERWIEIAP